MNIAIILAGGVGSRFSKELPKQFVKIAGKTVLEHTIDIFEMNSQIDEIAIVSHSDYLEQIKELLGASSYHKVKNILVGGEYRYESTYSAIKAYDTYSDNTNIILHDSVRPLLSQRIVNDCIEALNHYNAVDVAIPSADTIIKVSDERLIVEIPKRSELLRGQTPQAFKLGLLKKAFNLAFSDNQVKNFTDDCGIIRKYTPEEQIFVVNGDSFNVKLTNPEDVSIIDRLFQHKTTCFDQELSEKQKEKLIEKTFVIFGGSSGIGKSIVDKLMGFGVKNVFSLSPSQNGVDVTKSEQVSDALKNIYQKTNRIDHVIICSGVLYKTLLTDMTDEQIFSAININLTGSIIVARESFKYLKQSSGSLTLFTSSSYTRGRKYYIPYTASKAGVVNLMEALDDEWGEFKISVNCISPERTKTQMRLKNFGVEPEDSLLAPEKVAEATIKTIASGYSGCVVDVRRKNN